MCDRTKLLDWIETNAEVAAQAKQNFTNTDYAFDKPTSRLRPSKSPNSLIFTNRASCRKKARWCFLGTRTAALGYAAFRFL